jgi:hypothetical protein
MGKRWGRLEGQRQGNIVVQNRQAGGVGGFSNDRVYCTVCGGREEYLRLNLLYVYHDIYVIWHEVFQKWARPITNSDVGTDLITPCTTPPSLIVTIEVDRVQQFTATRLLTILYRYQSACGGNVCILPEQVLDCLLLVVAWRHSTKANMRR